MGRRQVNPHGWLINLGGGLAVVGVAIELTVILHRTWSWPLFAWGAVLGPIASGWAYYSFRLFGRALIKRNPNQSAAVRSRLDGMWSRYRATYAGLLLFCVGIGIMSAGMSSAAPDVAFTVVWVLVGVLPGVVLYPRLLRGVAGPSGDTESSSA